ncbi:putative sulfotransferase [Sphingomonas sp. DBB INV C78]|uniref:sulfotransferase family protein n=1 Tax=Sphingomonas sp. DBB INV C78 TaxID=3349434 RepID=UPI0036D41010
MAATLPDIATLMAEARAATGLSDFGKDDWYLEPLRIQLASINEEARLTETGAVTQRARLVGALANRLRITNALARHPEIHDEPLKVAAVLLGLPRTGTTMLHRLLHASPAVTAMRWCETHYPAAFPDEVPGDPSDRRAAAKQIFDHMLATIPDLMSIHPMSLDQPDEELTVLDQSFMGTSAESFLWIPSYAAWLEQADQAPAYAELVLWLKYMQWQDPARRDQVWVLKSPNHVTATAAALAAFPDATFVMTHRDPVRSVPSYCSMVSSLYRMSSDEADLAAIGRHWQDRWAAGLRKLYALREDPAIDARFLDVRYDESVKDPMAQARRVFDRIGRVMTPEDEAAMQAWMAGNARDGRPTHRYDLDRFGLNEAEIAETYAFYRARVWPERA